MNDIDQGTKSPINIEELSAIVVDGAYKLHIEAGPGLLETVYEVVLAKMLEKRGLTVKRQMPIPINLMGLTFDEGFRADLLFENMLLVELKSVENLAPVHSKQVLTYLRLLNLPLGLLINFDTSTFKEGCKRIVRNHKDFAPSREPKSRRYNLISQEITPFEAIHRTNPKGNEFCSNQRLRQGARLRQLPSL
jgi:iron complex transport system substrate-binding protein